MVSRRHLPLLLAFEPSPGVSINTCADPTKIQHEAAKAGKRRDLPCVFAEDVGPDDTMGDPSGDGKSSGDGKQKAAGDGATKAAGKAAQWKAPEPKKVSSKPKRHQLVASGWSVTPKDTFALGVSKVVMVESIDDLRSLATKCAESKDANDAIAAVAPFKVVPTYHPEVNVGSPLGTGDAAMAATPEGEQASA
eukprot:768127-Amphidinium_carterae.1